MVLVRLGFGHEIAWFVAPTAGLPSASPLRRLFPVALQFAILVHLGTGSALELAPVGPLFPLPPGCLFPVTLRFAVLVHLATGSALELALVGSPSASPPKCLFPVALRLAVLLRLATSSVLELASVWLPQR
ncbi:MAG: hypothetical protein DMG63_17055 [Acidobacteria bacterium]|nr:MAG: hypothetical protein DMG63_17055 [Acidobacteriota bacterium]